MKAIKDIERYILEYFEGLNKRFEDYFTSVYENRKNEIYTLAYGEKLMNLIHSIRIKIGEKFLFESLIPQQYATPDLLFAELDYFKSFLNSYQKYIDLNEIGCDTPFYIQELQSFKNEIIQLIDYIKRKYEYEGVVIPYQNLHYSLSIADVEEFIKILK